MKTKKAVQILSGIQTIESVMDALGADKKRAIYHIHRLRKQGYVKTKRLRNNRRVYSISFENRLGGNSYYDIINKYSPIKIATPTVYRIYGKVPSAEETLVYALKTKSFRTILAALALFRRIKDWAAVYRLVKESGIKRQVGALYDLARGMIKVRRMTKRFRKYSLPKDEDGFEYVIPGLRFREFGHIEKIWKVRLPFNKKDLEAYT